MLPLEIKIVFSALLGSSPITSHTVTLGGTYPDIEIEDIKQSGGLHHFKIRKSVPHYGEVMLKSVAAEASTEIEFFWSVFSYLRGTLIRPTGFVQYEHEGQLFPIGKHIGKQNSATLTVGTGAKWFESNRNLFHVPYNSDLLKRFNFARSLADPISRFLSLYSILTSLALDRQQEIDHFIRAEEPTVSSSLSPKNSKPETIFTRLRNELAHHRVGVSVFSTHEEICIHVDRFEWLVGRIIRPHIGAA